MMINLTQVRENSMEMPDAIAALKNQLSSNLNSSDPSFWSNLSDAIGKELKAYQARDDELYANICWFLKSVCEIRGRFVRSISAIKDGDFFDAWCELELVEIGLISVWRNPFLDVDEFEVPDLLELTQAWQKTYPYKLFISPEYLHKAVQCGICSANVTPWDRCEHEPGVVYCGVYCQHVVTDFEIVGISIVPDPVQKYSVIHTRKDENGQDVDIFDYDTVRFVADRVASPFDRIQINWTKAFHPHELFSDRKKDGPCPCESGRMYADCCLPLQGVLRPHMQVLYEKEPIGGLSNAELVGYGDKSGTATLTRDATSDRQVN